MAANSGFRLFSSSGDFANFGFGFAGDSPQEAALHLPPPSVKVLPSEVPENVKYMAEPVNLGELTLLKQPTRQDSDEELEYADNNSDALDSAATGTMDKLNGDYSLEFSEMQHHDSSKVGVYLNHGYARSFARFAADLGPAVWRIASKKFENILPNGVQFGPGWVGEDETMDYRHLGRLKSGISSGHPSEVVKSSSHSSGRHPQSAADMETLRRLNF